MDVTNYLEVISLIERLHREFLELVKLELETLRLRDVSNVQALMLFNIGDAEMTVGELTSRGCYLGSNVSYNVKKLSPDAWNTAALPLKLSSRLPSSSVIMTVPDRPLSEISTTSP